MPVISFGHLYGVYPRFLKVTSRSRCWLPWCILLAITAAAIPPALPCTGLQVLQIWLCLAFYRHAEDVGSAEKALPQQKRRSYLKNALLGFIDSSGGKLLEWLRVLLR